MADTGGQKLADLFVSFKVQGADGLDALFKRTHTQLKAVTDAANMSGTALEKLAAKHQQIAQAQEQLTRKAAWATLAAQQGQSTAALIKNAQETLRLTKAQEEFQKRVDWAKLVAEQGKFQAALIVTAQKMEVLARIGTRGLFGGLALMMGTGATAGNIAIDTMVGSFRLLSGEIGMAFIPILIKVSEKVQALAHWFHGLSGTTKATIANLTLWVTIGGGVVVLVYKLVTGIQALTAAIAAMGVVTGTTLGLLAGIGAVAGLVYALGSASSAEYLAKRKQDLAETKQGLRDLSNEQFEQQFGKHWTAAFLRRGRQLAIQEGRSRDMLALAARRGPAPAFMGVEDAWRRTMQDANNQGDLQRQLLEQQMRGNDIAERQRQDVAALRQRVDNNLGGNAR